MLQRQQRRLTHHRLVALPASALAMDAASAPGRAASRSTSARSIPAMLPPSRMRSCASQPHAPPGRRRHVTTFSLPSSWLQRTVRETPLEVSRMRKISKRVRPRRTNSCLHAASARNRTAATNALRSAALIVSHSVPAAVRAMLTTSKPSCITNAQDVAAQPCLSAGRSTPARASSSARKYEAPRVSAAAAGGPAETTTTIDNHSSQAKRRSIARRPAHAAET